MGGARVRYPCCDVVLSDYYWLRDNVSIVSLWRLGGFSFCVEILLCLIELSQ